jgi:tetratricopeptide (TPR) repeat protein
MASRSPAIAVACLYRVMAIDPRDPSGLDALISTLIGRQEIGAAKSILDQALARNSTSASAWVNRGRIAVEDGDWTFGLLCTERAVALAPEMFEAWMNLGSISEEWGNRSLAVNASSRAVVLRPDHLQARWNRTHSLLARGDWRRGFADFDVRLLLQRSYPHVLAGPRWRGTQFSGRLFVHDEIGYGDVFNFLRYLPLARERVSHLTFEVKPGLARLLTGHPGIDRLVERRSEPPPEGDYDAHVPLESLPNLLNTTVDRVPPVGQPLKAPLEAIERWSKVMAAIPGPRVGLCWAGNRASGFDHRRSCRLSDLVELLDVSGISFVSLQKIDGFGETHGRLTVLPAELEDFADTAAVIVNLDLVISVETSVAHLAGAMNHPLWILLAQNPAWRWLEDREDTPWYPNARLYRRKAHDSWSDLARRVARELRVRFA